MKKASRISSICLTERSSRRSLNRSRWCLTTPSRTKWTSLATMPILSLRSTSRLILTTSKKRKSWSKTTQIQLPATTVHSTRKTIFRSSLRQSRMGQKPCCKWIIRIPPTRQASPSTPTWCHLSTCRLSLLLKGTSW